MQSLPIYQIDAFTDRLFGGNPAAVVPLEHWLDERLMQAIALENNLSETAFFVPVDDGYEIRWFTPTREVPLCGHATLASAWVIFEHLQPTGSRLLFRSASGPLAVEKRADGWLELDFPSIPSMPRDTPPELSEALGVQPEACFTVEEDANTLVLLGDEAAVRNLQPDIRAIGAMADLGLGIIVTATGTECDFVSRYFAPAGGIEEDPVTGSTHCVLAPFWAARLGRRQLRARQVSARGGTLHCELRNVGDEARVAIAGQAVPYLEGRIFLP
ncbi:MAG: isomerase [Alteromonadaceae bacterium]|nr:isomerase [Alteromonadaceae bacterium]|tara:strand:- start:7743 stop:8558 length:816 start_codon:yes stop_codon:yes gene_type:complete